jgi:hypothetical protein
VGRTNRDLPAGLGLALALFAAACSDQGGIAPDGEAPADEGAGADVAPDESEEYTGPALLSQTGLYADFAARTPADGVLPYSVRYQLWSDGAEKSRFLWLPPGQTIDNTFADTWNFPVGTKAWKEFRVGAEAVETRYLEKTGPGRLDWLRVAFVWREDGTDADAAPDGVRDARGTTHDVPSTVLCLQCHTGAPDGLIGVSAAGRFTASPAASYAVPGTGVVQDALAYLHSNCGHCHGNYHPIADIRTLRLWLPVGLTAPEDAPVYQTAIGLTTYHNVQGTTVALVPGDPDASQIPTRMSLRGGEQMPPVGTEVVDEPAVATIRAWIEGM